LPLRWFLPPMVVEHRGQLTDANFAAVRQAGFTDGEIAEIIANVAMNIFTNYFNVAVGVEIDFPVVPALTAYPDEVERMELMARAFCRKLLATGTRRRQSFV
jgi:hypothetical protein